MRSRRYTTSAGALLLLAATLVNAKHGVHEHLEALHKRHHHHREHARSSFEQGESGVELRSVAAEPLVQELPTVKRDDQCQFPYSDGLVPVTPGDENAGWAMSPNQPCTPGNYCPYACPPGQVMMQWSPSATSYSYPESMDGGLYCDENGNMQKPFPDNPYCQQTNPVIGVQNNAGSVVSFCQTVLPGNEAMLIPTSVESYAQLAVPNTSYWCGTAAHYYINPPGITTDVACVWGTNQNPWGNWSPYVAGANTDDNGNTFMKLGWNPIYIEPDTPFRNTMPSWGVEIQCNGGGCNGLPCAIDPSQNGVNEMVGSATDGAGGAAFCVVTVPPGVTANYVITGPGGASSSSSSWAAWSASGGGFYQSTSAANSSWSATSTISASNTSSVWSHAPTHSPYYSLFNHTQTTSPIAATPAGPTTTYVASATVGPSPLPKTGAASTTLISGIGLSVSVLFLSLTTLF